ncbi:hypothetical protein AURDEDRAFT_187626 [Auricularia subglabra TFB-10046 SS5]|nr:hypothetical protein AURDEDRAFT_187626 [Auricularia subglabra TFB-10046 SS5]
MLSTDMAELHSRIEALESKFQALCQHIGQFFPAQTALIGTEDASPSPLTPMSSAPPSPFLGPVESSPDPVRFMQPLPSQPTTGGLLTVPPRYESSRRHFRSSTGVSTDSSELDYQWEAPNAPSPIPTVVVEQRGVSMAWAEANSPMSELSHIFADMGGFAVDNEPAVGPSSGIGHPTSSLGGNRPNMDRRQATHEALNISQSNPSAYPPEPKENTTWLVLLEGNSMTR